MLRSLFFVLSLVFFSSCKLNLLEQNRHAYEQICREQGHERGGDFYAICMQKLYHKDEDREYAQKHRASP